MDGRVVDWVGFASKGPNIHLAASCMCSAILELLLGLSIGVCLRLRERLLDSGDSCIVDAMVIVVVLGRVAVLFKLGKEQLRVEGWIYGEGRAVDAGEARQGLFVCRHCTRGEVDVLHLLRGWVE